MSGSEIGSVVGLVVGSFFGMPQLGMAIGGLIGGLVDPTKIHGPRIGDGQAQTATDGAPIAWVMGTASVAGTIAQYSTKRHQQVKVSGGKGGPPAQYQDELFQDFCIVVCESCSLRDSTMSAVLMVQQDGQIVYDVRPGTSSDVQASSTKWKKGVDFQFGDEAQLPHPTMEAITGVGNTPAYRGVLTAIFTNFNLTNSGNRIPNFLFTVASAATIVVPDNVLPLESKTNSSAYDGDASGHDVVACQSDIHFDLPTSQFNLQSVLIWGWAFRYVIQPLYGDEPDSTRAIPQGEIAGHFGDGGIFDTGWRSFGVYGDPTTWGAWWAARGLFPPTGLPAASTQVDLGLPRQFSAGRMMTGVRVTVFVYFGGVFGVLAMPASIQVPDPSGHTLTPRDLNYYLDPSNNVWRPSWTAPENRPIATPGSVLLSDIVSRVCKRGGLVAGEINDSELATIDVLGYPIAKQASASDCLGPILAAYFAYGSDYDGKMNFHFYGANTVMEILRVDLLEANGANKDAIIRKPRNQATEFPRRLVATYVDPAQNYTPVNVAAARSSINVVAIGDTQFPIPVTMAGNDAVQAVHKALKVAYATLQGTEEYSVPFAVSATYLALCAGDPVAFQGRRYVVDEIIISNGYVKLTARYDRQSAYTSTVQAIVGNPPPPPGSGYSGPTNLMAMNLPPLRPQDTYGIYLAASAMFDPSVWRGCVVQISYDGMVSWQLATQILIASTMGQAVGPTPVTPLTVKTNSDLVSVTGAQLGANANAYALVDGATQNAEIGQFETATETTPDTFQLTGIVRGLLGTTQNPNTPGDQFTLLDSVYFVPIDITFAGRKLYLRAIGFGESAADAAIISLIYKPSFRRTTAFETANTGDIITTNTGEYLEVIGS